MRLKICTACGDCEGENLEHHHLTPRSDGGTDAETNLVTLCFACHGKAHGYERLNFRARTRAGLAAAKARGVKLGNPANLSNQLDGSAKGNAAKTAKAAKRAADLLPLILPMKAGGASLRQIADGLNRCGVPAPRGGEWSAVAVKRILDRQV